MTYLVMKLQFVIIQVLIHRTCSFSIVNKERFKMRARLPHFWKKGPSSHNHQPYASHRTNKVVVINRTMISKQSSTYKTETSAYQHCTSNITSTWICIIKALALFYRLERWKWEEEFSWLLGWHYWRVLLQHFLQLILVLIKSVPKSEEEASMTSLEHAQ